MFFLDFLSVCVRVCVRDQDVNMEKTTKDGINTFKSSLPNLSR